MTKLLALTLFLFTIILISCNRDEKEHKNHNLTEHYFDNASAFQNRYEYDSDIFYYKKELNRSISDTVRIKSLIRLCSIFWWIEMPDSARQYFHESEKVYNNIKNYPHLLSTFLLNKGTYLQKEKEHIRSKLARDSALQIHLSIVLENDTSLSRLYNDLGKSCFFLNKTDSAIIFYNKALLIAKRKTNPDNMEVVNYLSNLGLMYDYENNYKLAEKYYTECDSAINRNRIIDYNLVQYVYSNIANFCASVYDYEKSFKYQNLRIKILSKHPEKYATQLYALYLEKSNRYAYLKQFENAWLFCDKASDLANIYKKNFDFDLGLLYYQRGYLLIMQGNNYGEALKMFRECARISKNRNSQEFHYSVILSADCYTRLKQYKSSIKILTNEIHILDSLQKKIELSENSINIFRMLAC